MTEEEFKTLKTGDIVYAEPILTSNEWHLCYVKEINGEMVSLNDSVLCHKYGQY